MGDISIVNDIFNFQLLTTGLGLICLCISLLATIILLVAEWKLFTKAGEPGWAVLIPFYNTYKLFKIVYGNGWKFLLLLVPVLGTAFSVAVSVRTALVFGKGVGFGILNIFFPFIMLCILAFGDASYEGSTDSFI